MELKSAQQVIKILQEERVSVDVHNSKIQYNVLSKTGQDIEAYRMKLGMKNVKNVNINSDNSKRVKHKIRILGDSHARGLATELKHRLNQEFEIQGVIKPGSTLEKLTNSVSSDLKELTKKDACIIWGGTNDVGRNETNIGIRSLHEFISCHQHTNVIVLKVPHRHDLASNSCINEEVKTFNRKLDKLKKAHQNLFEVSMDMDRDLFTRQGFHLNTHGKEQTASDIISVLSNLFKVKRKAPITLMWKEEDLDCNSISKINEKGVQCIKSSECDYAKSALVSQASASVKKMIVQDSVSGVIEIQRTNDQRIKSSEWNYVQSVLDSQDSSCSNMSVLQDGTWDESKIQRTDKDSVNQEMTGTPAKRIRRHPLK